MSKKKPVQPPPKDYGNWWGLWNWGYPRGVYRLRKEAIAAAIASFGEPWEVTRKCFRVARVNVTVKRS